MIDPLTVLTIVLMASATYCTRIIGYLVLRNRTLSPRATALMEAAPGCGKALPHAGHQHEEHGGECHVEAIGFHVAQYRAERCTKGRKAQPGHIKYQRRPDIIGQAECRLQAAFGPLLGISQAQRPAFVGHGE